MSTLAAFGALNMPHRLRSLSLPFLLVAAGWAPSAYAQGAVSAPGNGGATASGPVFSDSGYVRRVAFDTVVFMLLALGLNIVVGWGGLLDLGYVAFFGIGAYAYAMLASDQFGVHLPSIVAIPLVALIGFGAGWLVGLPSRRLTGDYLAIVTLFFGEVFVEVVNNVDSERLGGPNGIPAVDPINLFGIPFNAKSPVTWISAAVLVVGGAFVARLSWRRIADAWDRAATVARDRGYLA